MLLVWTRDPLLLLKVGPSWKPILEVSRIGGACLVVVSVVLALCVIHSVSVLFLRNTR